MTSSLPNEVVSQERSRVIVVREPNMPRRQRWYWAVEEKRLDGWTLRKDGHAMFFRSARDRALRRVAEASYFGSTHRMEFEVAREYGFVPLEKRRSAQPAKLVGTDA